MNWLKVIITLLQAGLVAQPEIEAAIKSTRGLSDTDTLAEDDAALLELRAEIARYKAEAQTEADRTS